MTPPRLAQWLVSRRLAGDERDEIIGDLAEQFAARVSDGGRFNAWHWYWREALGLLWGFGIQHHAKAPSDAALSSKWRAGGATTDLRFAWRSLRRSWSFAWIAWLTLTCGIGLSTAMSSLIRSILLHPLPYDHSDRIVRISEVPHGQSGPIGNGLVSDTAIGVWLARSRALAAISPYSAGSLIVRLPDGPTSAIVADVGAQFFSALSTAPLAGRLLDAHDAQPGAVPAAVISRRLWERAYGARPEVTRDAVQVDGTPYAIVGVAPSSFEWPAADVDLWRVGPDYRHDWPAPGRRRMFSTSAALVGRLRDGATLEDANAEGASIALQIAAADQDFGTGKVEPSQMVVRRLLDDVVAPVRPALILLGAGMSVVLVTACINLASLLLSRHTARQRDLRMRAALGATRWRIVRPVAFELLLLGLAGTMSGASLAVMVVRLLPIVAPNDLPRLDDLQFDGKSLAAIASIAVLTVLVVGLAPVLRAPRASLPLALVNSGRVRVGRRIASADRVRGALVIGQITLAVALLVVALLVGRSFRALLQINSGFRPEHVVTFQVNLPRDVLEQPGRQRSYYATLLDRLARYPDVRAAGYGLILPLHTVSSRQSVNVEGRPPAPPTRDPSQMAVSIAVSTDYLSTLGTAIVRGRGFVASDTNEAERVVLVDESLSRRYFPGEDPIGRRIRGPGSRFWTIVGIVQSVRLQGADIPPEPTLYFHDRQLSEILAFGSGCGLAVRTTGDPLAIAPVVRAVARDIDASAPVFNFRRLEDAVSDGMARPRFMTVVLGLFATLALATALLGIYGVLSYFVERQRVEFGIRRALGATERHIVALVTSRGARLAVVGLGLGALLAVAGARLVRRQLFGVAPLDPISFAGAAAVVLLAVAGASWQPVRRALRIDPARVLKLD